MNLVIARSVLLTALTRVLGVIPQRSPQVILTQVLLEARGEALHLTGTNGVMTATTWIDGVPAAPSPACLPAHPLQSLIAKLPDGDVKISIEDRKATITVVGKKPRGVINGLDASGFPTVPLPPRAHDVTIPGETILSLVAHAGYAVPAGQDAPARAKGLFLEWDSQLIRAVALDAHRLAMFELEHAVDAQGCVLIPAPAVKELRRLAGEGDVSLTVHGPNVIMSTAESRVTSKLIDGEFPPYRQILPAKADGAIVSTDEIRQALGCAGALADDEGAVVRFEFREDALLISNREASSNRAQDEVACGYKGPERVVYCDLRYIRDACAAVDDETVSVEVADARLVLRAPDHLQFVMTKDPAKAEPTVEREAA